MAKLRTTAIVLAALGFTMTAFIGVVEAISITVANFRPRNALLGTTLEFITPADDHSFSCGRWAWGHSVATRQEFVHVISTVILCVTEPCLQDASSGSNAEVFAVSALRNHGAVLFVCFVVAILMAIADVVLVHALAVATADHSDRTSDFGESAFQLI